MAGTDPGTAVAGGGSGVGGSFCLTACGHRASGPADAGGRAYGADLRDRFWLRRAARGLEGAGYADSHRVADDRADPARRRGDPGDRPRAGPRRNGPVSKVQAGLGLKLLTSPAILATIGSATGISDAKEEPKATQQS